MTTRKTVITPVDMHDCMPLPADWFSRTRKCSSGLTVAAESARQQSQSKEGKVEESLQNLMPGDRS